MGFPGGTSGKEPTCQWGRHKRHGFDPWVRKIPWRRVWQPIPVFLLGEPVDRGVWWAIVHGVAKSQTWLKQLSTAQPVVQNSSRKMSSSLCTGVMSHFFYIFKQLLVSKKAKSLSCVWLFEIPWTVAHRLLRPWDFPGKSTGVGCHCLLRQMFIGMYLFIG